MLRTAVLALFSAVAVTTAMEITEFHFGPGPLDAYPGYEGPLSLKAKIVMRFGSNSAGNVTIGHELEGVEKSCTDGGDPKIPNSCGIHIHEGESCDGPALPGGHLWDKAHIKNDPWARAAYSTNHHDDGAKGVVTTDFGGAASSVHHRALVVHDHSGARVTCTLIGGEGWQAQQEVEVAGADYHFGVYPGYKGAQRIKGRAMLRFRGGNVTVVHELESVEKACTDGGDPKVANSCGIHIHEGSACDDPSQPGGHYFNKDVVSSDPWATATYTTNTAKPVPKSFGATDEVGFGWNFPDSVGRALVIHDHSGARVTCDIIPRD